MRRTSNEPPEIDYVGVGITVTIAAITGWLFIMVSQKITQEELERMEDVEYVCAGFFGCGTTLNDIAGLFGVALVVTALAVIVVHLISIRGPIDDTSESKSPVEIAKQRYVDGEIQTTVKLEDQLEDYIEREIDDTEIQEIDDLLDQKRGDNDA